MSFKLDRCKGYFEVYCLVITCNTMQDRGAVLNSFVKGVGTGKDVMHAGKSAWVVGSGETGVSSILVRLVMKECVFYLQGVCVCELDLQ